MESMDAARSRKGTWGDAVSRRFCLLDAKKLCEGARRKTGLEDFGEPPIEPALSVLVKSLEEEADLHPLGRFLMRAHLQSILETRLRLAKAWQERKEAPEATPIQRPVFITGMPRSGSTFLHELLAEDPENRAPRVWEVMFPIPEAGAGGRGPDPRIAKTARCLWWFRRMVPQADLVYPMRAGTPHECIAIHSYTLLSEEFVSTCRIPSYEAFLRATGLHPAYAWQKRFLQHLQEQRATTRWVLKTPDHAYGLEELFSVFPDAVVIQTHRDPLAVLRSSSQLITTLRGLFARPEKDGAVATREARVLADAMERFIQFRDRHPELAGRFIDMKHAELVANPLAAVRRIYKHLGAPLTELAASRMQYLIANRSRYKGHRVNRTLAELGYDALAEARRFDRYSLRFGIPCAPIVAETGRGAV
jgi:hypothetical protein